MNYTLKETKEYLKELSIKIRLLKILRKEEENQIPLLRSFDSELIKELKSHTKFKRIYLLWNYKNSFRYHHIAYCLFRGKTIDQIEKKTNTIRDDKEIKLLVEKITNAMEDYNNVKDVCLS